MNDIRTIFEEVSRDQPPSSITSAGAVRTGRRARRHRSLLAACGVAVAVAGLTVGIAVLPGQLRAITPAPGFAAGSELPSAAPTGEPPAQAAARLTSIVQTAASHIRPDAQFLPNPYFREGSTPGALVMVTPGTSPDLQWYEGFAEVVDGHGAGQLSIRVTAAADRDQMGYSDKPCTAFSNPRSSCTPRTGPDGERLSVGTNGKDDGTQEVMVTLYNPDGSIVDAVASNFIWNPRDLFTLRAGTVFTIDQLIALVTTPGLTVSR